jgi:curli production assembly/transport component CsgF
MHDFKKGGRTAAALLLPFAACLCLGAQATELVYTPIDPSFGGNPLNGAVLLNAAQAQNRTKDPEADLNDKQSALQQFNDTLQRAILGRLAAAATSNIVDPTGKLKPGTVETGDFIITITDMGGGSLRVTTTDKTTGGVTSFEVGS